MVTVMSQEDLQKVCTSLWMWLEHTAKAYTRTNFKASTDVQRHGSSQTLQNEDMQRELANQSKEPENLLWLASSLCMSSF